MIFTSCHTMLGIDYINDIESNNFLYYLLTERKILHTHVYGLKEFVTLSACDKLLPQLSQGWQNRMG